MDEPESGIVDCAYNGQVIVWDDSFKDAIFQRLAASSTFYGDISSDKARLEGIENHLYQFAGPPFTLQRFCEILTLDCDECRKYYPTRAKLLNAVEKLLCVISTTPVGIQAPSPDPVPQKFLPEDSCDPSLPIMAKWPQ
eukprot:TRINITY_DN776110_c0_g1_i1.p1 TRINITY_DN776110_c0_g1~~TRINITY_DN776110_c0_g1_i1.p1  ORF type:complete len:139 (+),score=12.39 TRINITY_DN776110_c0_g1_i1:63-479(+)